MTSSKLAMEVVAIGLTAGVALAQEPGFGGHGAVSKNQIPGPNPSGNATDPAAGNPGSPIPTDPKKQEDLYGSSGAATGETGSEPLPPPPPPPQ